MDIDESRLREVVGLRPDVQLLGEGTLSERIWARPAVAVLGIDAPPVAGAAVAAEGHDGESDAR